MMDLVILKEMREGESRVALAPDHIRLFTDLGFSVRVEAGAGSAAGWSDADYAEAGAAVAPDVEAALLGARVAVKVRPPLPEEIPRLSQGTLLISFLSPADPDPAAALAAQGVDALALERVPRTTRAQRMDALSSQATAVGYVGALMAASHLPRFLPMLTTAAGTIRPARVLVLGAGVAGLQAIATARRLGARVRAYDIRAAAAEQVQSLGATFVQAALPEEAEVEGGYARELSGSEEDRQHQLLMEEVPAADAVITTAQIPGRPAPRLITAEMVERMAPGSVIVDLAADTGGNCEVSRPGETIRYGPATVVAPLQPAARLPQDASRMLGRNIAALVKEMVREGELVISEEDDIVDAALVVRNGQLRKAQAGG